MSMLFIVPTPIGNLGDITDRARSTLKSADFIAAEDTRVTLKLLNHLEIKKPLVSYYEHNREQSGQRIVSRIASGETCALVTDAGTPTISDPGADLAALCIERGLPVVALPGPCAAVTALSVSGLPVGRFCFEGFLSVNKKNRETHLNSLRNEPRVMVFYEAPHKLKKTLSDLLAALGDRSMVVCRELTKLHEEVIRTTLSAAVTHFEQFPPKGEFVLVVAGATPAPPVEHLLENAVSMALSLIKQGQSPRDAVRTAAGQTGARKSDVYAKVLKAETKAETN